MTEKEMEERYKSFLACGVYCGKGWHPILERLFEAIDKIPNKSEDFKVTCIKEKFGGLRVYADCSTDEIENLITKAEAEADRTCERCGKPGQATNSGWIKTLCPNCRVDAGYELNTIGEVEDETDAPENEDQDGNREE